MLEIVGIDHIVLRTDRLQDMLHFYCTVLGCKLERETAPQLGLTQLRAGNALIDIVDVDSELGRAGGGVPGTTENNMDHFCLQLQQVTDRFGGPTPGPRLEELPQQNQGEDHAGGFVVEVCGQALLPQPVGGEGGRQ